jgi:hypothetical protein
MQAEAALDEPTQVYHWRRFRFLELGFNRRQAASLAESGASWHEAETLLAGGCPPDLVFDLLS